MEIILVDDGSSDLCGAICDEYAEKDKRIKVYHKENSGLSSARNYGAARANGEYLGFVDSDDWIEPNMYEELFKQIEDKDVDMVTCGFYYEYLKSSVKEAVIDKRFDNQDEMIRALIYGSLNNVVWNKLFRKSCFEGIFFPEGREFEDIATTYKMISNATSAVSISKPLYHYRMRKGAITQVHSWKHLIDYWLAYKERSDYFLQQSSLAVVQETLDRLMYWYAIAISKTWRWAYGCPAKEKPLYQSYLDEMRDFSRRHLPWFGKKGWPLFLKVSCFMSKFDNPFVFGCLYFMNQLYRRMCRTVLYS